MPISLKNELVVAANYALTRSTHSSYATAEKMWWKCACETQMEGSFPASDDDILIFAAWLIKRGLSGPSIEVYLSGIRTSHLIRGLKPVITRTEIVKTVIAGRTHIDQLDRRAGLRKTRLPVTVTMLKLLKEELRASSLPNVDTLALWAIASLLFFGGFRPGEILCKNIGSFDPAFTFLKEDLTEKPIKVGNKSINTLQVFLKSEKTDSSERGRIIDVYSSNSSICPVKAVRKYFFFSKHTEKDMPTFRLNSGKPITTKLFNSHIKTYLGKHVDSDKRFVSGHSFRSGVATLIGQLGYSDEQLKAVGRWSSDAYLKYLKLPRTKRLEMAQELGSLAL